MSRPATRLTPRGAVAALHDHCPDLVEPAGDGELPLESFHYDMFLFQTHVCAAMDERDEDGVRKGLAVANRLLKHGDDTVIDAVCGHFFVPYFIHHPELAWARPHMSSLVADLTATFREHYGVPEGDPPVPD